MKIYLVGFMGSGKTTIGRELAARIDAPFFDLDELIEAAEKMSIKEIFAQRGEPYFRKRERDLLRSTKHLESRGHRHRRRDVHVRREHPVHPVRGAVGVSRPRRMRCCARGWATKADRPLFRDDLATHELYANRIRYYRMSDLTIEVREEETPAEIVERLVLELPKSVLEPRAAAWTWRRA